MHTNFQLTFNYFTSSISNAVLLFQSTRASEVALAAQACVIVYVDRYWYAHAGIWR